MGTAGIIGGVAGIVLGGVLGWLVASLKRAGLQATLAAESERARAQDARATDLDGRLQEAIRANGLLQAEAATLRESLAAGAEKLAWAEQAEQRLREAFEALASKALQSNAAAFAQQTREQFDSIIRQMKGDWSLQKEQLSSLVQPVEKSLKGLDEQVRQLEQRREGAYKSLEQHLGDLKTAHRELRDEAGHLRSALSTSSRSRGRWGELQLRRIVELTGMLNHVDFEEQVQAGEQRPDMVIRLPNGGLLCVDAKTPLEHYLQASDAPDPASQRALMKQHAADLRAHVASLGRKEYWKQFERTPEVVVMFVPSEAILSSSFEDDPELIEDGLRQHVLLATPVTLYGLLKAVAYGWQQQAITENAIEIANEGRELCERLGVFVGHLQKAGRGLDTAVRSYNEAVGSAESRLMPAARRLRELGATTREIDKLEPVERQARLPAADGAPPPFLPS